MLDGNLSVKNAPKHSAKYLEDKACKIQNLATVRTFSNQLKIF